MRCCTTYMPIMAEKESSRIYTEIGIFVAFPGEKYT